MTRRQLCVVVVVVVVVASVRTKWEISSSSRCDARLLTRQSRRRDATLLRLALREDAPVGVREYSVGQPARSPRRRLPSLQCTITIRPVSTTAPSQRRRLRRRRRSGESFVGRKPAVGRRLVRGVSFTSALKRLERTPRGSGGGENAAASSSSSSSSSCRAHARAPRHCFVKNTGGHRAAFFFFFFVFFLSSLVNGFFAVRYLYQFVLDGQTGR